jgi:hypothetical protein
MHPLRMRGHCDEGAACAWQLVLPVLRTIPVTDSSHGAVRRALHHTHWNAATDAATTASGG